MEAIVEREKGLDRAACIRSVIATKIAAGYLGRAFGAGKIKSSILNILICPVCGVILPPEYTGDSS
ncbi:MAG: hypothetical protein WC333_09930 [Dehalococcoidia bacterium]|jgi:hypothetical protein